MAKSEIFFDGVEVAFFYGDYFFFFMYIWWSRTKNIGSAVGIDSSTT